MTPTPDCRFAALQSYGHVKGFCYKLWHYGAQAKKCSPCPLYPPPLDLLIDLCTSLFLWFPVKHEIGKPVVVHYVLYAEVELTICSRKILDPKKRTEVRSLVYCVTRTFFIQVIFVRLLPSRM